jgi:tagatose-6-phosphate ketose/aldose isomerase
VALPYLVFAQYLALFTSLEHGKTPDNPFPSGEVSRVVRGVTIYPLPAADRSLT